MAERRMFAKTIIDSDAFLDMSASAQALYFHLGMRADDDGFVNNPKKIQRTVGAAEDDLKILLAKRFLIAFESGVVVIKHWRMHNYIQNDRHKPTVYQDELALLQVKDNRAYTEVDGSVSTLDTTCIQPVSKLPSQNRLVESSEDKGSTESASAPPSHKHGRYGWVKLTDEEHVRLQADLGQSELARCIAYIDESAQSSGNKNKWKDWNLVLRRCSREKWGIRGAGKVTAFHAYDQDGSGADCAGPDLLAEARAEYGA